MENKVKEEKACTSTTKQNTSPLNTATILLNAANSLSHITEIKGSTPVWMKPLLSIEEAADYFGIGRNKLYELTNSEDCLYVLFVGEKRLIKRDIFEDYLKNQYSI